MKIIKTTMRLLLASIALLLIVGCASDPEPVTAEIVQNDLIGAWEIEKPFTYKEDGVAYGKAKDILLFSAGSSETSLFLEVTVELTEVTSDAPDGFEIGSMHSLFFNEANVTITDNVVTLDAKAPYISPSSFDFTFEEGNKTKFVWDGVVYNKK